MSVDIRIHGHASVALYEDAVIAGVRSLLEERLAELLARGASSLPAPQELAEAMAAGIPDAAAPHPYAEMGPFYSSSGVMRLLGISTKQALDDRRRRGTVLGARTVEGTWVYPAFQFDPRRRRVHAPLVPVLAALKAAPRWGAALWLTTEHPQLSGRTPLVAASDVRLADDVVRLAAEYAAAVTAA